MNRTEEYPGRTLEAQVGVSCSILVVKNVRLLRSRGFRTYQRRAHESHLFTR